MKKVLNLNLIQVAEKAEWNVKVLGDERLY